MNYNVMYIQSTKQLFTVWGNAQFGCELAYVIGNITDKKILIMDFDFISPKAHFYYGTKSMGIDYSTGTLALAERLLVGETIKYDTIIEYAEKVNGNGNMYVLPALTREFETVLNPSKELLKAFEDLIKIAHREFDTVVCLVGLYPNQITSTILRVGDTIIVPVDEVDLFYHYTNILSYLKDITNVKFIGFDHKSDKDGDYSYMQTVLNTYFKDSCTYLGKVGYSKAREDLYNNSKNYYNKLMTSNSERKVKEDYIKILSNFEIIPKQGMLQRLMMQFSTRKIHKDEDIKVNNEVKVESIIASKIDKECCGTCEYTKQYSSLSDVLMCEARNCKVEIDDLCPLYEKRVGT